MTKKQAISQILRAYHAHGGGSPQHIAALKLYDKIAGTWSDYAALANNTQERTHTP